METARVDIRKLQLLNDRISQCLDALAQVRLSVHGLSPGSANTGIGAMGAGQQSAQNPFQAQSPFQQSPFQQSPFQQIPFQQIPFQSQNPYQQTFTPFTPPLPALYGGLSHSPFGQQLGPQQGAFWAQQQGPFGPQQQNPFAQQQIPFSPFFGQGGGPQLQGLGTQIPGWAATTGLSHTGNEIESLYGRPLWADPVLAARVRETFPYAGYTLPPFVSLL